MALIWERWKDTRQNFTQDGGTQVRVFDVLASSGANALQVLKTETSEHITYGVEYQDYRGSKLEVPIYCQSLDVATRVPANDGNGQGLYQVTVSYAAKSFGTLIIGGDPPEDGTPRFRINRSVTTMPADHDIDGNPIQNTVGEPFEPPSTVTVVSKQIIAEWIAIATDWTELLALYAPYEDKTNSESYKGTAPECLYCPGIDVDPSSLGYTADGKQYFKCSTSFDYRPPYKVAGVADSFPGWVEVRPNLARRTWTGTYNPDGSPKYQNLPAGDDESAPLAGRVFVSADGKKVLKPNESYWLIFRHKKMVDFNLLGL